jgi:predicted MFS family arabinose efflux permease
MAALSPAKLARARGDYEAFNALNAVSFSILASNLLTLLLLRLGASNAMVGLLSALTYSSFFFMPLGKSLVRNHSIVGIYSWGWLLRYLAMVPVAAVPLLGLLGRQSLGLVLVFAGFAGFNIARGVAMIGNNPVLASLAEGRAGGRDRGAFLSQVQVTGSAAALLTSLAVALVLRASDSLWSYAVMLALGLLAGFLGVSFQFRLPEPHDYRPPAGSGLWRVTRDAFRERPYRRFMLVYILLAFTASMARAFIPVWARDAWGMADNLVMFLSFAGGIGTVAMGLLSRLIMDRLGPKPLYVIYTVIAMTGLLPAVLVTPGSGGFSAFLPGLLLLGFVFILSSFGLSGEETAGQAYHFALVPKERTLDLAVAYFVAHGLGGTAGSLVGGLFLDALGVTGLGGAFGWRLFWGAVLLLLLLAALMMGGLVRQGSASVRESLGSLFSLRDLRAFDLMSRLERSGNPDEEVRLIREIGDSRVARSQGALVEHLASPRFEARMEALLALEDIEPLSGETLAALVAEVERHPYTTAYVAARILGLRGGPGAVPILRQALSADDYMLRGAAVVALARLGDRESAPRIEEALKESANPRVRLSAAYALELLGRRESIPALVSCFRREDPPAYVSDELVLAMARILGIMERFYPAYAAFMEEEARGRALLEDAAPEGLKAPLGEALASIFAEQPEGRPLARLILETGVDAGVEIVLAEAALDPSLGYRGFRFFMAAYVALTRRA